MLKKLVIVTAVLALGASACSSSISISDESLEELPSGDPTTDPGEEPTPGTTSIDVLPIASLQPFAECAAFLAYVKGEALERVTPWGLDGGYPIGIPFEGEIVQESAAEDSAASGGDVDSATSAPVQGEDFSGTNVQVVGVDEADIVKTDGERIVSLVDGLLKVVDVSGSEAVTIGTLRFDEIWPQEMLLDGDTVLVLGSGGEIAIPVEPLGGAAESFESFGPTTAIAKIDISGDPTVESLLTVEGNYLSTRAVDGTARVAISSPPVSLPFVYPSSPASEETALETNKEIIRDSNISHWMPDYVLESADGTTVEGQLVDCSRVHSPAEFSGFDVLSVLTVDIAGSLTPGDATAVVASGETVYASGENFYIATSRWSPPTVIQDDLFIDEFEESYTTDIHKFSMVGSEPAEYLASGEVRGHAINQFAFHEWEGDLFVTTTDGSPWGFSEGSESYLTAFEQQDDVLVKLDQVGDMGKGEQVYSVRYIADQAYVVTFRQVDPLYVVDLRDPTDLAVTGELKIPGFSSYLHPLGGGLLLGVGQEATDQGVTTGSKVSLFDVTDPTAPRQISTWTLPGGQSDVEWDHRAFLYWEAEQMAVLPMQSWEQGFAGAIVLTIDGTGLSERGRIDHSTGGDPTHGSSDCKEIEIVDPDITEEYPEILVLICDADDDGGAAGHYCDVYTEDEANELAEEFAEETGTTLDLEEGQRVEICWPDGYDLADPVLRSLVIGDDLWTLSRSVLQANDIDSLERTQRVN